MAATECPIAANDVVLTWLIVLGPALVALGIGCFQLPWDRLIARNPVSLELLQHLTVHGAFYGFALVVLLGIDKCEPGWLASSFVVFFIAFCVGTSYYCGLRLHTLAKLAQ
jgi:hypothetical protein